LRQARLLRGSRRAIVNADQFNVGQQPWNLIKCDCGLCTRSILTRKSGRSLARGTPRSKGSRWSHQRLSPAIRSFIRFQAQPDPLAAIAAFLTGLAEEANRRGYHFDVSKILHRATKERISETRGQLLFEWKHLQKKLHVRAPLAARKLRKSRCQSHIHVLRDSWEHKIVGEEVT